MDEFVKIEQIVAQQVANAIEAIAIYETKTRVARDLMNQVERQEDKMAENASNKRKWKGDYRGSSSQNKGHKVIRAHNVGPSNKKVYAEKLPYYNKCKFHHTGRCTVKCGNCKWIGYLTKICRAFVRTTTQRPAVATQKTKVTCYECGILGHYKSDCPK
ncbi:reverse transcriptase domain-containing protein [Tanacetum coccineum]